MIRVTRRQIRSKQVSSCSKCDSSDYNNALSSTKEESQSSHKLKTRKKPTIICNDKPKVDGKQNRKDINKRRVQESKNNSIVQEKVRNNCELFDNDNITSKTKDQTQLAHKVTTRKKPIVICNNKPKVAEKKREKGIKKRTQESAKSPDVNKENLEKANKNKCYVVLSKLSDEIVFKHLDLKKSTQQTLPLKAPTIQDKNSNLNKKIIDKLARVEEISTNAANIKNCKTVNKKSKPTKKLVTIESSEVSLTKPSTFKFRERKLCNYAESSLEASQISKNSQTETVDTNNKVPRYKLWVNNNKVENKGEDLYEFDSDSEKQKKKKRIKRSDSTWCENQGKDINHKQVRQGKVNIIKKTKNLQRKNNKNIKQITCKIDTVIKKAEVSITAPVTSIINNKPGNKIQVAIREVQEEVLNLNNNTSPGFDYEDADDGIDYFGFNTIEKENNKDNQIKIISNIRLTTKGLKNINIATPTKFNHSRPNANSTMVNNILTPWRFNEINIRRNPHFLTLKNSSLPSVSQEMVLDHTLVDKIGNLSKKAQEKKHKKEPKKKTIQTTVTDYFTNPDANKDQENVHVSLFDDEMFSPLKENNVEDTNKVNSIRRSARRRILGEKDENIVTNVQTSTPNRSPRRVLGEKDENNVTNVQTSTRIHKSQISRGEKVVEGNINEEETASQEKADDIDFFGFDSNESSPANDHVQNNNRKKEDKPFRLSININDKKYTRKGNARKYKKPVLDVASDEENESGDDSVDLQDQEVPVRLFEDFEPTVTFNDDDDRLEDPKFLKKRKAKWLKNDTNVQKCKKRKDVRTKQEEEEAEKWAAAFNSMCEEIEAFPLEIE